jgi:cellulose synthase/poly-beta-1,6-N-acetylglucosamine synthase-like glycosyltransferase
MAFFFYVIGFLGLALPVAVYPLMICLISWAFGRRMRSAPDEVALADANLPAVSLIVSAYNEQSDIREKLINSLALAYAPGKLEIIVISDASTDQTDKIVESFANHGVRLLKSEIRVGKSLNITNCVPKANGEILVFSDANSFYERDAVTRLISHFSDSEVGYVVGAQRYRSRSGRGGQDSENRYWELELKIKEWESDISSVVGGDGAIFAMRKHLFEPLRASDISDFLGPLRIIEKGYRGVFEPKAICYESAVSSMQRNFFRKVRIITRSLQAITKVPNVLLPWRTGWFAVQVWLHKVLRWFSPVFMMMIVIGASIETIQGNLSGKIILGLVAAWGLIGGLYLIPRLRNISFISLACYTLVINAAALVAIVLFLVGRNINTWSPDR